MGHGRSIGRAVFEKMEAGLNAPAVDYAKLGVLYGDQGAWNGEQVVSADWVDASTSPEVPDFAAEGDHGQFIYVSPSRDLVIVRNGTDYGIPAAAWMDAFYAFASLDR